MYQTQPSAASPLRRKVSPAMISPEAKVKATYTQLPEELKAWLIQHAWEKKTTPSAILRGLAEGYRKRQTKKGKR